MYIGLVGKSCSGKNYVGELFSKKGYQVLDLDELCHKAYELAPIKSALKETFGPEVLDKGVVSRKALGKVVFDNPTMRTKLENILYSWLKKEIFSQAQGPITFLNGALLRRAGLEELCKLIIYVDAPYEDRLGRALARDGITKEAFEKREAAQQDVDYRNNEYKAPVVIITNDNNTKAPELVRQINNICDRIKTISLKENEDNEEK